MTNNILLIHKWGFRRLCGLAGNGKAVALIAFVQGIQGRQQGIVKDETTQVCKLHTGSNNRFALRSQTHRTRVGGKLK
jgi:hypothetical protein